MVRAFVVPKKWELCGRASFVLSRFRNSYEYAPGVEMVSIRNHRVVCRRGRSANRQVSLFPRSLLHTTRVLPGGRQCFSGCSTSDVRTPPGRRGDGNFTPPDWRSSVSCRAHLRAVTYLLALRSSRRLWPARLPRLGRVTSGSIAAPRTAPLTLGWVVSFGGGCVFGGGLRRRWWRLCGRWCLRQCCRHYCTGECHEEDVTLAECFMSGFLQAEPPVSRCSISAASARRGTACILTSFIVMLCFGTDFLHRFHMLPGSDDPRNVIAGSATAGAAQRRKS